MNILIRKATEKDIKYLIVLLQQLFSLEADFTVDTDRQFAGLKLILKQENSCVLVGEVKGEVVGMVTSQLVVSTAEGAFSGLIEDMVVKEEYRGKKIGKQLLDAIEKWSFDQGASRVVLQADRDNHPALEFYTHQNWKSTNLISFHKFEKSI